MWREQSTSNTLPGFSGGKPPEGSKVEEGREEEEEGKEGRKMDNELLNVILAGEPREETQPRVGSLRKLSPCENEMIVRRMMMV